MSELNKHIHHLFKDKKVVAFYINHLDVIPDEWMTALGQELQKRGYGVVGLLSGDAIGVMNLDALGHVFHITPDELEALDSVSCFMVTDLELCNESFNIFHDDYICLKKIYNKYPQSAKVLAIIHSCGCSGDPREMLQEAIFPSFFDGYIVGYPFENAREKIKNLWDNFSSITTQHRPETNFYLMGYGYPKLCLMRQKFLAQQQHQEAKSICYAPTDINHALYFGGNRVQQYGKRILRSLLTSFPDYTVIFRPTPLNRNEEIIQNIITYFRDEPRVVVDTQTSYLDTFVKTQVMITDFAHIATTFSTITHRPAVYFKPWLKEGGLSRCGLFYTTNSFSKLALSVKHALTLSPLWNEQEKDDFIKSWGYLPFDNALTQLADDLADFIADRPHPDWLPIRRDRNSRGASPARVITAILQEYESLRLGHAVSYTYYFQSKPLAVFAIHLHKQCAPELVIPLWLQRLADLADCTKGRRYGDVASAEIARLYRKAADTLQAEGSFRDNSAQFLRQLAQLAELNTPLDTLAC